MKVPALTCVSVVPRTDFDKRVHLSAYRPCGIRATHTGPAGPLCRKHHRPKWDRPITPA